MSYSHKLEGTHALSIGDRVYFTRAHKLGDYWYVWTTTINSYIDIFRLEYDYTVTHLTWMQSTGRGHAWGATWADSSDNLFLVTSTGIGTGGALRAFRYNGQQINELTSINIGFSPDAGVVWEDPEDTSVINILVALDATLRFYRYDKETESFSLVTSISLRANSTRCAGNEIPIWKDGNRYLIALIEVHESEFRNFRTVIYQLENDTLSHVYTDDIRSIGLGGSTRYYSIERESERLILISGIAADQQPEAVSGGVNIYLLKWNPLSETITKKQTYTYESYSHNLEGIWLAPTGHIRLWQCEQQAKNVTEYDVDLNIIEPIHATINQGTSGSVDGFTFPDYDEHDDHRVLLTTSWGHLLVFRLSLLVVPPILSAAQVNNTIEVSWTYPEE